MTIIHLHPACFWELNDFRHIFRIEAGVGEEKSYMKIRPPPGTSAKLITPRKTKCLPIISDLGVKKQMILKPTHHENSVLGGRPTPRTITRGPSQPQSLPVGNVSYAALLLVNTPVSLAFSFFSFFSILPHPSSITDSSGQKQ